MKSSHQKVLLTCIAALMVLVLFSVLLAGLYRFDNKYTAGPPYGEGGVLVFSEGDLERPIFLIDGWILNREEVFIGQYSNFSYLPSGTSPFGKGRYELTLRYAGTPTTLLLELPEIFTDYTLYVNGQPAAVRGSGTVVSIPVGGGDTWLLLDTENHTHYYSGLTYPPAIGTSAVMNRLFFIRTLFYAVLLTASLTLAAFTLVLWLSHTRNPLFFHFGLLCVAFAVFCAHPFVWQCGVSTPLWYATEDASRLLMLAQAAAVATLAAGHANAPWYRRGVRPVLLAGCVICFVAVLWMIPAAGSFVNSYGLLVDGFQLAVWAYLVFCAGSGLLRGDKHSFFILSACGVLGISLLAGLLDSNRFEPIYTGWQNEYAGFLLVLLFGGLMVQHNAQLVRESAELQVVKLQNRFAVESAAQIRDAIDQVRGLKHELRHHVETMSALYAAKDYARLGDYLAALEEQKEGLAPLYYTENYLVNAIVSSRLGAARSEGVRVDCRAHIPETLPIADGDLCMLLSNLLDNALEACRRLPPEKNRFIALALSLRGELLLITCQNAAPSRDEREDAFPTSKLDADSHGLGISTMRRVAEKYDGVLEIGQEGTVFTLHAVLRLPQA